MKFRVWCKEKNEWEKDIVFIAQSGEQYHTRRLTYVKPDNHIITFSTGIVDKESDELFFDDIVELVYGYGNPPHYKVCQNEYGTPYFEKIGGDGSFDGFKIPFDEYFRKNKGFKIIGNIYENPKLLKVTR